MKKKIFILGLCLLALTSGLFAQKRIVLKVATIAPSRSPWEIQMKKLGQKWSKITHGQVKLIFLNAGNFGGEHGVIQKMRTSRPGRPPTLAGAVLSPVGLNELAPNARVLTLAVPFLIQNQKELDLVLGKYGDIFEKEIEKSGTKLLTWSNAGWLTFYTKEKFSSLDQLKKLKIACAKETKDFVDLLTICGFNTYPISQSRFNQAIKSSTGAEGFSGVHILTCAMGLERDISYVLDTKMCPMMSGFVISEEWWKLIPNKYKPEMLAALEEMRKNLNNDLDKMEEKYLKQMKRSGVKTLNLSKSQEKQWRDGFYNDMKKVNKKKPKLLNMDVYEKISKLLENYRK